MRPTLVRRTFGTIIPPKIASPASVSGGSGAGLAPLVEFYSKLPKGPSTASTSGIKARYFNGKNASGLPILGVIFTLLGVGYTIDYHMHLKHHKNHHH